VLLDNDLEDLSNKFQIRLSTRAYNQNVKFTRTSTTTTAPIISNPWSREPAPAEEEEDWGSTSPALPSHGWSAALEPMKSTPIRNVAPTIQGRRGMAAHQQQQMPYPPQQQMSYAPPPGVGVASMSPAAPVPLSNAAMIVPAPAQAPAPAPKVPPPLAVAVRSSARFAVAQQAQQVSQQPPKYHKTVIVEKYASKMAQEKADIDALSDLCEEDMQFLAIDQPNEEEAHGRTESSPQKVQKCCEQMSKGDKRVASSKKSINLQYVKQSIQDFLTGKLSADIQCVNKLTGDFYISKYTVIQLVKNLLSLYLFHFILFLSSKKSNFSSYIFTCL
jgi:hypothetical protein